MDDVQLFLAHAIELEREAARRYEDLTAVMQSAGNADVAKFFSRMAAFSRRHLGEAMARGGFHSLPQLAPQDWQWPEGCSPEAAAWEGVDGLIDVVTALDLALDAERRGFAYYQAIAVTATDAEVRRMAAEFAGEEGEHVTELERWRERAATV